MQCDETVQTNTKYKVKLQEKFMQEGKGRKLCRRKTGCPTILSFYTYECGLFECEEAYRRSVSLLPTLLSKCR